MAKVIFINGLGYCKEIIVNRYNQNEVIESYTIYEPIKTKKIKNNAKTNKI
jgi:hypothetical protein